MRESIINPKAKIDPTSRGESVGSLDEFVHVLLTKCFKQSLREGDFSHCPFEKEL